MTEAKTESGASEPRWNEQGLVPAIVQDSQSGEVLMMAWMNAEAWKLTLSTKEAHFWSRSRKSMWRKGETSGNVQRVVSVKLDCDADTVLLKVEPAGPACHTGERNCFFTTVLGKDEEGTARAPSTILRRLQRTIAERKAAPNSKSYTAKLFADGIQEISKKVGEEATEVVVAALAQSDERLISEAGDVIYHLLVLLAARNLTLEQVEQELERRHK